RRRARTAAGTGSCTTPTGSRCKVNRCARSAARSSNPRRYAPRTREEKRRGNDAPWKAWKTQKPKASFPLFPPGLEIRQKAARISTFPPRRRRVSSYSRSGGKNAAATEFQLTDPGHFKHDKDASGAPSLRCEGSVDRLGQAQAVSDRRAEQDDPQPTREQGWQSRRGGRVA